MTEVSSGSNALMRAGSTSMMMWSAFTPNSLGMLRVSLYLSAEEKAIAVLTAEQQGRTLSDVLRSGIINEATRSGILKNGEIVEKHRMRINAYKNILEAEAQIKKGV